MVRMLSLVVLLIPIPAAFADIPLPKGVRRIKPVVRFEGIEKHADHVFFLRYLSSVGPPIDGVPPMMVEVKDAAPIELFAGRFIQVYEFFALNRDDFNKRVKDDPSRKWLTEKAPGVLRADMRGPITTATERDKVDPVTVYRVSIRNGKLHADMVKDAKRSEVPLDAPFGFWAYGLALTISLTCFGVWYARRRAW